MAINLPNTNLPLSFLVVRKGLWDCHIFPPFVGEALECPRLHPRNDQGSFGEDVVVQHRALEAVPDDAIVNQFVFMGPLLTRLFAGVDRVPEDKSEPKNT